MANLDFKTAFKYPFNRAKGMWNILWVLFPIFGWFALGGYSVRIVKEFSKGKFKKLPIMQFGSDFKLGFFMFIKSIPFMLVYMLVLGIFSITGSLGRGLVDFFLGFFVIPILTINFLNKETVASFFELKLIGVVFNNLGDYIVAVLKSILLGLIFIVMWIILVGIPAGTFTKNIFLADFYRRNVK